MSTDVLRDQRVIVIGGSSGIGFAVARGALAAGAGVVIASSNEDKVGAARSRLGDGVAAMVVDVRDEASVAGFFAQVGPFDHLVFTAGDWGAVRRPAAMAELDFEHARAIFAVRFWGALAAIKHGLQGISSQGSITLTDGLVAHRPRKGAPLSTAMAGAIEHLTRALAVDLAPLRVNAVCPGIVMTEVWDAIPEDQRDERIRRMTERQPLPRGGDPAEIAEAYLYLLRGGFSTGQVLIVDGGTSLT